MPTNTLTDARCKAAKPADKLLKLFDGGGLHLAVTPKGAKVWRVAYRIAGKPQTMSVGPYPEVGLAVARQKRDELKAVLRDGGDPMAPRRATRATLTLRQASEAYWDGRKDLSASYLANATRGIEQHLGPQLGDRPISSISREDLLEALMPMNAAGHFDYVRKVRMWVGQVFDWAVEHGHTKINPAKLIDPAKAFGRRRVEHFAALPMREVPELLRRLELEGELQSVLACRLLALTWVRTNELRFARWDEIDGSRWEVDAARMKKKGRPAHIVPLPRQALPILAMLKARAGKSPYVLPAEHRLDRPISENAVLALLYRLGYKGKMTGHGWRSIASTWANESGFSPDAIERQLAHSPDDEIRAAYNRAQYLPERTAMLQAWADWLDAQTARSGEP